MNNEKKKENIPTLKHDGGTFFFFAEQKPHQDSG